MSKDNLFSGAFHRIRTPLKNRFRGSRLKSPQSEANSSDEDVSCFGFEHINMGKSNKFDYTNRPNSGAKLGHIIGSALQKEAEKVKKDAEKHHQKARKQSTDSTAASSDNVVTTHIIDLKAPSKDLGDEGVIALADGLESALKDGTQVACLALEDLNLSGNGMTTVSVARLAPIIEKSRFDLKTLNLANNDIRVDTDQQASQWEAFLKSFKGCFKLRRLDLSGNEHLGRRAIEILARIHTTEQPISPIALGGESSVLTLVSEGEEEVSTRSADGISGSEDESMAAARLMKRRCGLRSIPYLTLHNIGLDDAGALWLSYIMADHYYPNQLIDELNATNAESLIKTYQQDTSSCGVDWTDNSTIGKEGKHLLERAATLRRQTLFDDTASLLPNDESISIPRRSQDGARRSTDRRNSRAAGDRRISVRSIRTEDGGEHEVTEVESVQRRIQRHIIAHDGPHSVDLWRAALQVLRASRMILYITPVGSRKYYIGNPKFKMPALDIPDAVTVQPLSPTDSPRAQSPSGLSIDVSKAEKSTLLPRRTYAATLSGSSEGSKDVRECPLTDVTNTPITPLIAQKRMHREGAFSEGTDMQTVTEKLEDLLVKDGNPDRFIVYQMRRITSAEYNFRNTLVPCHLPYHLLERILSFAMGNGEMDVMSTKQKQVAIERSQTRDTLMAEREWLKKDESAQLWMMLDTINCLTYCME